MQTIAGMTLSQILNRYAAEARDMEIPLVMYLHGVFSLAGVGATRAELQRLADSVRREPNA